MTAADEVPQTASELPRRVSVRFSDLSPSAQIRAAALKLFAERGVSDTSLRGVAAAAGVSLGAIAHHFHSKADLERAVQDDVVHQIQDAVHGVGADLPVLDALRARREAFRQFLSNAPEINGYLRRVLSAGDENTLELSKILLGTMRTEMDAMVEQGIARPLDDPDAGLALYFLLVNAPMFVGPLLKSAFGLDVSNPADLARLHRAEIDLLTKPLFRAGPAET